MRGALDARTSMSFVDVLAQQDSQMIRSLREFRSP